MASELLLIDGNSLTHAAFHALPPLNAPDGTPTNAVKGFIMSFFNLLNNFPTHVCVVFDMKGKLLRHDICPSYKATRGPMSEDLAPQFRVIQEFLKQLNIPTIAMAGYEADDIIATLTRKFHREIPIRIATRDRDLLQLCDLDNVCVHLLRTGGNFINVNRENVTQFFGVTADKIALYKAIAGDPSDNIKGVRGIGPSGAVDLVTRYGTYENIVNELQAGALPTKYLSKIASSFESFEESYALAQFITKDTSIGLDVFERKAPNVDGLENFYKHYAISI